MSKKNYKESYDELSPTHRCERCSKQIKARLVRIKGKVPKLCYRCFQDAKVSAQRAKAKRSW